MTPLEAWHQANPQPKVPPFIHFVDGDAAGNKDPHDPGYTVIPYGEPFVYSCEDPHSVGPKGAYGEDWYEPQKAWFNYDCPNMPIGAWCACDPKEALLDLDEPVWAIMVADPPVGEQDGGT